MSSPLFPAVNWPPVSRWDEIARDRIARWMRQTRRTQKDIGEAAGHNQAWCNRWLGGEFQAGVEEVGRMAEALGQKIAAVFDEADDDPQLTEVLSHWGGLSDEQKAVLVGTLRTWDPPKKARRSRKDLRTPARSGESADDNRPAGARSADMRGTRHR